MENEKDKSQFVNKKCIFISINNPSFYQQYKLSVLQEPESLTKPEIYHINIFVSNSQLFDCIQIKSSSRWCLNFFVNQFWCLQFLSFSVCYHFQENIKKHFTDVTPIRSQLIGCFVYLVLMAIFLFFQFLCIFHNKLSRYLKRML